MALGLFAKKQTIQPQICFLILLILLYLLPFPFVKGQLKAGDSMIPGEE